ncbi:hypothetical protein [Sinomonas sp.]|uniref:hypothetical protein n=1 Tax=Sinomonas sp. TaxID=1914986 RepID=UPI003F7E3285
MERLEHELGCRCVVEVQGSGGGRELLDEEADVGRPAISCRSRIVRAGLTAGTITSAQRASRWFACGSSSRLTTLTWGPRFD